MRIDRHAAGLGHPSYECYRHHGCRCSGCVDAQREVRRRYYVKRRAERMYPVPHTLARLYREIGLNIRNVSGV